MAVDREPVLAVLRTVEHSDSGELRFSTLRFADGTDAEFSAEGLVSPGDFTGCAFFTRGFSDPLVKFIFDVACAGDMVIMPALECGAVGLVSEAQRAELPPDVLDVFHPVLLSSANDLGKLLLGELEDRFE